MGIVIHIFLKQENLLQNGIFVSSLTVTNFEYKTYFLGVKKPNNKNKRLMGYVTRLRKNWS